MRYLRAIILILIPVFCNAQDSLFLLAERQFQTAQYQEAFQTYKSAGLAFQTDNQLENYAVCNIRMAFCFSRLAAYNQSIELADNTISYVNEVLSGNDFLIAEAYRAQGDALLNIGKNDEAREILLKAERLYPPEAEIERAEAFNQLGVIYFNNENRDLALQYLNQALDIRKRNLGNESMEVADTYNNIGLIYADEDGLQAGIYFNRALKTYERTFGTVHPKVAFTLINLALARSKQGLYSEATDIIDRVVQIWDKIYTDDHPNKSFTTLALSRIYRNQGNFSQALHFQEIALQQYIKLFGDKHPEVANVYFLMGEVHKDLEDYKEAVYAYQQSIFANLPGQQFTGIEDSPTLANYLNPDILLSALLGKAKALEALHFEKTLKARDLKRAIDTYRVADTLVTEIRKIRVTEKDKIRLGEISRLIYGNGIRLSLVLADQPFHDRKYNEIAFRFCERSKSSVLLEAIQETKAKSFSGIPQNLIDFEDSVKNEIAFYQQKIAGGENMQENQTSLFAYQQAYRDHIDRLEREYPKYFNLKYQSSSFDIGSIQDHLSDQEAIVSYYDAANTLYIFTLTNKNLTIEEKFKDPEIYKMISGLRNSIKYRIMGDYEFLAMSLYETLIPELPKDLAQLILIPDGILNTVPYETLINPETKDFLVQQYSVSYDYSTSLMAERSQQNFDQVENKDILLVAPVDFGGATTRLNSLPASEEELKEIGFLFRGNQWGIDSRIRKEASEEFIKSNGLDRYRYLHFATHGMVNESKPELSRIFLSPGENEDGSLYSGDIYNLKINAELVSLSACETGLGKIAKGEGIVGLSRALLYAGAQNLMVSLWQVTDQSTAELMIEFYRQHLFFDHVKNFSTALREAKLKMIGSNTYNDPYYWAPFILVGQ